MTIINFKKRIQIDAPKVLTWKILGNLQEADKWILGIEKAELNGDIRKCETSDGHHIIEKISDYSEKDYSFSYDQIQTPLPVKSSSGKMKVISNGKYSEVIWEAKLDFIDNETKNNFDSIIDQSFEETLSSLKFLVESQTDKTQDYTRKINVKASPRESYDLLTNKIGSWWTEPKSMANSIGDEPTFQFGEAFWTMKVTDLVKNSLVRWECIVAHHIDENLQIEDATEWLGTELEFNIVRHKEGSQISLTHYGLNPSLNCFDICEAGWDHYFVRILSEVLNKPEKIESKY